MVIEEAIMRNIDIEKILKDNNLSLDYMSKFDIYE